MSNEPPFYDPMLDSCAGTYSKNGVYEGEFTDVIVSCGGGQYIGGNGVAVELRSAEFREFTSNPPVGSAHIAINVTDGSMTQTQDQARAAEADDEWPRALERLRHTEPHPDQGIACVGTADLAMALDRLGQFADVALGNAMEISRLAVEYRETIAKQAGEIAVMKAEASLFGEQDARRVSDVLALEDQISTLSDKLVESEAREARQIEALTAISLVPGRADIRVRDMARECSRIARAALTLKGRS